MSAVFTDAPAAAPAGVRTPLTAYQKKLMFFLSVACFFEGYDFFALAQILPSLKHSFAMTDGDIVALDAAVNFGAVAAYLLVRAADKHGRKPLLTVTITGYTIFSILSGLAPNIVLFGVFQFLARMFLVGEWAVATIFAAEEFPADRRGLVIGVIQAMSSLGAIACAGIVPEIAPSTRPELWPRVFFVGGVPLAIIALARRGIRETARFQERGAQPLSAPSVFRIWSTPWRWRLVQMALIWAFTYVCTTKAVFYWKYFAVSERGLTDHDVRDALTVAALGSLPLVFLSGRLLDRLGRKSGSALIFTACALSVAAAYLLHGKWPLTAALTLGVFGTSAVLPVLNTYTAELFPTELRSDAFAWSNNLLGRLGAVLSPFLLEPIAERYHWGPTIAATAIGPLLALMLILWKLPETRGKELEETSAL
jgi:putative MFS transporter